MLNVNGKRRDVLLLIPGLSNPGKEGQQSIQMA